MRPRAIAAAALAGVLALAGCTADKLGVTGPAVSRGADSAPLQVSFASAPASLDPAKSCTGEDRQLLNSLYVRLVDFGAEPGPEGTTQIDYSTITPYLARSWDASDDGKTYTFKLKTGWKFPSGTPMDARAVEFSLERALKMNQCGAVILHDLYTDPPLIKEIEAPDAETLVIRLSQPDPQVLAALADTSGGIVDPSLVKANGGVVENEGNAWMDSHSAGGGAFVLQSYAAGASAVLKANPDYGGLPPASKEIRITWVTSPSTQLLNVQNGTTDIAYGLSGSALNSLKSDPKVRVVSYDDTQSMLMTLPNNQEPWTNRDVREAVVKAIPTEDIIKNVVYGFGKAYYGPIPPSMPGYSEEHGRPVATDVAGAKALIAKSGVRTPIDVTLDILAGDQNQKALSTVIQSALKEIGINVSVRTLTSSAWNDAVYNGKSQASLRFDGPALANAGYYLQYDEACSSVGSFNTGYICVKANTPLLDRARGTADTSERDELYAQLTENWVKEYPRVTLYQSLTPFVLSSSVRAFHFSSSYDMRTWAK
ncbi:ABC transporter substrate-binding protein [Nonomuraea phyllanthi]|uniref:ABC transporter substrate-binding protein n=1 Tax=Nonomuraea phyllanthi TaxID=2219224 RepID=A0A5C4VCM7_9ACTN|nr:ABC transporter substrate-binding protein [Nonomuraea phyllanthi]KAB8188393.1 ABC transporter substrate-binding protein [Nonomuraea phyllanthi]QFY09868.1 ABC transporter substrate-binding protein [Nonomuraea phyllanthi]